MKLEYETNVYNPRRRILGRPLRAAATRIERLDTSQGYWDRPIGNGPRKPPHRLAASKIRERLLAGGIRRAAGFIALHQLVYIEQNEAQRFSGRILGFCIARLQEKNARLRGHSQD